MTHNRKHWLWLKECACRGDNRPLAPGVAEAGEGAHEAAHFEFHEGGGDDVGGQAAAFDDAVHGGIVGGDGGEDGGFLGGQFGDGGGVIGG